MPQINPLVSALMRMKFLERKKNVKRKDVKLVFPVELPVRT
jgi:hypothetical protein